MSYQYSMLQPNCQQISRDVLELEANAVEWTQFSLGFEFLFNIEEIKYLP